METKPYLIIYHDKLDHTQIVEEWDDYEVAIQSWTQCIENGSTHEYDLGYELVHVTEDDDGDEDWNTLEYEELKN